jgi:hypothetical protein
VFYLLLAAVPVAAATALLVFGRVVDSANGGRYDAVGRLQAIGMALLLMLLVFAAAVNSPLT